VTPKGSTVKKKRLGKGLSAIVGEHGEHANTVQITSKSADTVADEKGQVPSAADDRGDAVRDIPLELILPSRHQPRDVFDETALRALADSIKAVGVIQPVVLRPVDDGLYELIAGERRVRASKLAGLDSIPAIVKDVEERWAAESTLIENLQREDLNPIERSEAIRGLIETFGLTQKEVAERVGLDRSSVSNLLRLSELEPEIRDMLAAGLLGLGHGKALLSAPAGAGRVRLAERAVREGWSVRRLESESSPAGASRASGGSGGGGETPAVSPETADLERRLGAYLGTKVSLRAEKNGRGSLTIRFFTLDHFDDVMMRIGFHGSDQDEYA